MKDEIKNIAKNTKGITLIALVITIIVLLILAGVSIAMLTGEKGILNQAQEAKSQTEFKSAEEKVKLAIMGARADDGQITVDELKTEVGYQGGSVTGDAFPVEVQMDGHTFSVDANGTITSNGSGGDQPAGQGTLGTVIGTETTNTTVQDKLGNQVVVPAGFKVQNPHETVPDGIVIVDANKDRPTLGSEFVWIPVGTVNRAEGEPVTIELKRYVFKEDGTIDESLTKTEPEDQLTPRESGQNYYYTEGLKDSTTENTHAKDIEAFKTSAVKNKGYYLGRYEARDKDTTTARTNSTSDTNQLVCTPINYVYNYVTQQQAAERSQQMYAVNSKFTSDLVNSYAWNTAIVFLQAFDNREDKIKPYSLQTSLNTGSLAEKGTNQLVTKDVICNVYDMASNAQEWTTETFSYGSNPCVSIGGLYNVGGTYTSRRSDFNMIALGHRAAFRPILYL